MSNTLNIETANFGNNAHYMFLYDPAVYLNFNDGQGDVGLGYLEVEKKWKQTVEYAIFKTGIPKTEVRRDMIDQEFTIEATLKQLQPETIALLSQRTYNSTDATWNRVIMGTDVPTPVTPACILVGQNVNGQELRLYIRKLQITAEDLEIVLGGDDYASVPFKGTAQKDSNPLTTNPTWPYDPSYANEDNIAFWAWPKSVST